MLLQHATATAAEQSTRDQSLDSQDEWDALTHAVHGADPGRYPRIAAVAPDLVSGTAEQRLSWGFNVLINGVLQTPVR